MVLLYSWHKRRRVCWSFGFIWDHLQKQVKLSQAECERECFKNDLHLGQSLRPTVRPSALLRWATRAFTTVLSSEKHHIKLVMCLTQLAPHTTLSQNRVKWTNLITLQITDSFIHYVQSFIGTFVGVSSGTLILMSIIINTGCVCVHVYVCVSVYVFPKKSILTNLLNLLQTLFGAQCTQASS